MAKLLLVLIVLTGCGTVQVPMGGHHVNRPHAGGSQFGARLGAGYSEMPFVQGTVEELTGPDGVTDVVNPIPDGDRYKEKIPVPAMDFAITAAKRFDIGVGSRGVYGMADVLMGDQWALTLSPAVFNAEVGDAKQVNEDGTETDIPDVSGKIQNLNLTVMASHWWGDDDGAAIYLYSGLGANRYTLSISDDRTFKSVKESKTAPTVLVGVHFKAWFVELNIEGAATQLQQRDGKTKQVLTSSSLLSLRLDFW